MNILICDDNLEKCEDTMRALESKGQLTDLAGNHLTKALKSFFEGLKDVFNGQSIPDDVEWVSDFTGYDIAIVDNNLTGLQLEGARLTAETIIGYLRAFTDIPYIVSLNKNLHVDFDLRYLFGDCHSLADIALNTRHLSNRWLWESNEVDGFSPWYWPHLKNASDKRRKQETFIAENLDELVWIKLGFPEFAEEYMSMRAISPMKQQQDENYRDSTFKCFFDASHTLPPGEMDILREREDEDLIRRAIIKITAYEVDRWIRRDILGTQDVLIDVPHLLAQMPHLLGSKSEDFKSWNDSVTSDDPPFNLDCTLFDRYLRELQFKHDIWVPKSCFWWPSIKNDDCFMKEFYMSEANWPNTVFCEDISQFVIVNDTTSSHTPKEFEVEIPGSWGRRYACVLGGFNYSPTSRILGSNS